MHASAHRSRTTGLNSASRAELLPVEYVRDLEERDLVGLVSTQVPKSQAPRGLTAIRPAHHTAARLLGCGMSAVQVSEITGYSTGRLSDLQRDPAFQELMSHYSSIHHEAFVDVHKQVADVASGAIAVIQERLEKNPDEISLKDLRELAAMGLDRTGYGPTKTINNRTVDVTSIIKELAEKKSRTVVTVREDT